MRVSPLPEFQSEALLARADFGAVDRRLRREAARRGCELHEGHGRSTWCQFAEGEFGAKKRGHDVLLFVRAHRAEDLERLRRGLSAQLAGLLPPSGAPLEWSGGDDAGKPPTSFSLAWLRDVTRLTPDFLRLRLEGPGLARLMHTESMHFRLLLPPAGDPAPEWPRLAANGQILWPKGAKALHRPVYTVSAHDPEGRWIETDVFLHSGGRTGAWARSAPPGHKIGISGPSGGGIPESDALLLAGDPSAYPAMARILAARPHARGTVWLLGRQAEYPWPRPVGMVFQRVADAQALAARLADAPPRPESFLWMAMEKAQIAVLRELLTGSLAHDKARCHLASYWTREARE
ncbi:MAG: siderophore-interacting protein [Paracoccus sp. (in: a-proteobacteria)]|uniref:siderophore-interacting protein n=1 Tax=Paracoccus sp. TaxID=267 RepID=UPI0039E64F8C